MGVVGLRSLYFWIAIAACYAAWTPFHSGLAWHVFVQDDCFYYLKVAQNLATGHGSTFNGLVATNGYHPLWLLLLTLVCALFGQSSFFPFIALMVFAAILATYFAARIILRRTGVSPLVASTLAALVAAFSMPMFFTGMEVILTIPIGLFFLRFALAPTRIATGFITRSVWDAYSPAWFSLGSIRFCWYYFCWQDFFCNRACGLGSGVRMSLGSFSA